MEDSAGFKEECAVYIWRNHKVTEVINKNFPGEWERDIAFLALALVADSDPAIAAILGAEKGE
jgi:hypothetical protein